MRSRDTRVSLRQAIPLLLLVALPGFAQEAGKPQLRQNRPDIPEVDRSAVICFAYYTVNKGVLKMTASCTRCEKVRVARRPLLSRSVTPGR